METDVYEFMRKTLELPSFVTPRFFDPSVYRYEKLSCDVRKFPHNDDELTLSAVVKEVESVFVKRIFKKFDETHQTAYFVESQNHLISKFFRDSDVIIDPFLEVYLNQSPTQMLSPMKLGSTGTVTKIGSFYDNTLYVNNTVRYHNNTLKTFEKVYGHIRFDRFTKDFDQYVYEFSICYEVVNPRQYHIFNEENRHNESLRLDLLNNYMIYKKTKEYIQKVSSS